MPLSKKPVLIYTPAQTITESVTYFVPAQPRECVNVVETVTLYQTYIERYTDDEGEIHTFIIQIPSGTETQRRQVCTQAVPAHTVTQTITQQLPGGYYVGTSAEWNAASRSIGRLTGDGSYVFTARAASVGIISGVSEDPFVDPVTWVPWAFLLDNGFYTVLDYGKERIARTAFTDSTEFKITRSSTTIEYYVDDVLVYTSLNPVGASTDLYADTALYLSGDQLLTYAFEGAFTATHDDTADVEGTGDPGELLATGVYSTSILPDDSDPLSDYAVVIGTSDPGELDASTLATLAPVGGVWVQGTGGGAVVSGFAFFIHSIDVEGTGDSAELLASGDEGTGWGETYAAVVGTGDFTTLDAASYRNPFENEWPDDAIIEGEDPPPGGGTVYLVMSRFLPLLGEPTARIDAGDYHYFEEPRPPLPLLGDLTAHFGATLSQPVPLLGALTATVTNTQAISLSQSMPLLGDLNASISVDAILSLSQPLPLLGDLTAYSGATLRQSLPLLGSLTATISVDSVLSLDQALPLLGDLTASITVDTVLSLSQPLPLLGEARHGLILRQSLPLLGALNGRIAVTVVVTDQYAYVINAANGGITRYTAYSGDRLLRWGARHFLLRSSVLYELVAGNDAGTSFAPRVETHATDLGTLYYKRTDGVAYFGVREDAGMVVEMVVDENNGYRYQIPALTTVKNGRHNRKVKLGRGPKGVNWSFSFQAPDDGRLEVGPIEIPIHILERRHG